MSNNQQNVILSRLKALLAQNKGIPTTDGQVSLVNLRTSFLDGALIRRCRLFCN